MAIYGEESFFSFRTAYRLLGTVGQGFVARSISRLPPGGPGRRSVRKPVCCNRRRTAPLAQ